MTTITLLGGAKVWVDLEIDRGRCKACRQTIYWSTTMTAKKMPICQDEKGNWVSHFANCPKADFFRKKEYEPRTNGVDTDMKWIPKI
jgi:hypothetical protein